jgi:hypothetical protein
LPVASKIIERLPFELKMFRNGRLILEKRQERNRRTSFSRGRLDLLGLLAPIQKPDQGLG